MRTLTRRVELLEARHRAAAGVPEWLAGYDPASPEAQSWFESRYDVQGFLASLTDDELTTYEQLAEVDPAAMSGDDLETMATLSERLQAFRGARSVNA